MNFIWLAGLFNFERAFIEFSFVNIAQISIYSYYLDEIELNSHQILSNAKNIQFLYWMKLFNIEKICIQMLLS